MGRGVTVAVDVNGADLGPTEVLAGVHAAVAADPDLHVLVFGPADLLGTPGERIRVIDAPLSIAKAADPARAVRGNPESSIVQAVRAVAAGEADAFVSGGSTGAALAAGLFNVKRARGIHRPALAIPIPVPGHPVTLLDVGANVEARPEHLVQFAFMGSALARTLLGIDAPRVGLLANGEEPVKGTPLIREAHERLSALPGLEFVGNVEGTDLTSGRADVIVTDGFTGNIALKALEGASQTTLGAVRDAAMSSLRAKLGGLLLKPALQGFREEVDPEAAGGAYLLGLRGLGIIPHGRFSSRGYANAISLAARGVTGDVVGRTHTALEAAGALRAAPQPSGPTPSVS
jgi:glycerol-3-phosphate acyltransferase PlsX